MGIQPYQAAAFPLVAVLVTSTAACSGGVLPASGPESPAASAGGQVGKPSTSPPAKGIIPDITLEKVDGTGTLRLKSIAANKVLVVVFWATWCDSCKMELVALKDLYARYSGKGLEIVAVSMDRPESSAEVQSEVHRLALSYPVVYDTESRASASLNQTAAAPFTIVVDRKMKVVLSHEGYLVGDIQKIESAIKRALLSGE